MIEECVCEDFELLSTTTSMYENLVIVREELNILMLMKNVRTSFDVASEGASFYTMSQVRDKFLKLIESIANFFKSVIQKITMMFVSKTNNFHATPEMVEKFRTSNEIVMVQLTKNGPYNTTNSIMRALKEWKDLILKVNIINPSNSDPIKLSDIEIFGVNISKSSNVRVDLLEAAFVNYNSTQMVPISGSGYTVQAVETLVKSTSEWEELYKFFNSVIYKNRQKIISDNQNILVETIAEFDKFIIAITTVLKIYTTLQNDALKIVSTLQN